VTEWLFRAPFPNHFVTDYPAGADWAVDNGPGVRF